MVNNSDNASFNTSPQLKLVTFKLFYAETPLSQVFLHILSWHKKLTWMNVLWALNSNQYIITRYVSFLINIYVYLELYIELVKGLNKMCNY